MFTKAFDRKELPKNLALALVGGVFVVGIVTVAQQLGTWVPDVVTAIKPKPSSVTVAAPVTINDAEFDYYVPAKSDKWSYDGKTSAYDKATGVAKYLVTLTNAQVNVTISQQKFPSQLGDRKSAKFAAFVNDANVTRSQDVGRGTLYFLPAVENGSPTTRGSNTVIYATDNILMFGTAGRIVGYDGWAELMAAMRPH